MSSGPAVVEYEPVVSLVRSRFLVKEHFLREDGSIEFKVGVRPQNKASFEELWRELRGRGLVAVLHGAGEEHVLKVGKAVFRRRYNVRLAFLLFLATTATVFVDGVLQSSGPCPLPTSPAPCVQQAFNLTPVQMGALFLASLMGILGLHELGHKLAAARQGVRSSLPYFIPGIPGIGALPTFGAVIISGEPTVNRDRLFDLAFAGPLLGLTATVVLSIALAPFSVMQYLTPAQVQQGQAQGLVQFSLSTIMILIYSLTGLTRDGLVPVVSPVAWAIWLGFFLHFLNLLPAWQLDGGHMARAVWGGRVHRMATLGSAALLAIMGQLLMAVFILVFSLRTIEARPLDDVSPLSLRRRWIFVGAMVLAALSAPIPWFIPL